MPRATVRYLMFMSAYSPLLIIFALQNWECARVVAILLVSGAVVGVAALMLVLGINKRIEPHQIMAQEVEHQGSEAMGYIVTYLIPFLGIDLSTGADLFSLVLIVVMLAVIYVNSSLLYVNPLLSLLGYNLFSVTTGDGKRVTLLSKLNYIAPSTRLDVVTLADYVLLDRSE